MSLLVIWIVVACLCCGLLIANLIGLRRVREQQRAIVARQLEIERTLASIARPDRAYDYEGESAP